MKKAIDLLFEMENCEKGAFITRFTRYCDKDELEETNKEILHEYAKKKKIVERYEAITNKLFEAMSKTYIKVCDSRISLMTAYFFMEDFRAESYVPCGVPMPMAPNVRRNPRISFLEGHETPAVWERMCESETSLANPLNIELDALFDEDDVYRTTLKAEFYKAMSNLEVDMV